jgi:GPH family glycoside/pentoside/hexuronide:cation symporter
VIAPPPSTGGFAASPPVRLSTAVKATYAAPSLAIAAMAVPVFVHMNRFYADVVAVPLGWLALAIALARAFDALTDPVVGWLSDRTRSRWGRRRPFLVLAAPLCAVAYVALFSPPETLGPRTAALWFGASFLFFFVFNTIFTIPYNALGPELTLDYHERSTLFGWRESVVVLGTLIAAPLLFGLQELLGSERAAFSALSALLAVLFVLLATIAAARLRERPEFSVRRPNPFVPGVRRALRNRPFRILLSSYVVGSITAAIPATLLPFFIGYVVRPDNEALWTTLGITGHFLGAFVSIPLWVTLSRRIEKKPAWLAAIGVGALSLGGTFWIGEGDVALGLTLFTAAGFSFGGQILLTPSIQADVIDYDELHTGHRREAQYGALWALLPKLVAIPGAAVPLAVLGTFGYVPGQEQTPEVVLVIRVLIALVPAAISTLSLLIALRFPISRAVHEQIRAGIDAHARGELARDPLTGELLAPPDQRGTDEATGWLLDHFSRRELRHALRRGPQALLRDAALAASACLALGAAAAWLAAHGAGDGSRDPGPLAVVAIVGTGLSFAALAFHVLRIPAALRLRRDPLSPDVLRSHLGTLPDDEKLYASASSSGIALP